MRHTKLPALMTPAEMLARVASGASDTARAALTRRSGTIYVPNADGVTGTIIGPGAGTDTTGTAQGVAQWVGDTMPPGKPTGCSCSSAWGTVYCRWDGTLEGGVPADFAYVSVSVSGAETGRMAEAGVLALDGYEDGTELDVSFVAYDAARDRTGALAPNASEATVVHVTVVDARAEIDAEVSQAREDAEAALEQAQQTATDVAAGVQEAKDAAQAAKDAADDAKATADGYQQQITEVTTKVGGIETDVSELSAEVSGAVEDAKGALSAATKAQQDIDGFKTTVEQTYQPKGDYATSTDLQSYATKSEVQQTADELSSSVEKATETAEGALSQASQAKQTADSVKTSLETNYVSKTDASQTYASKAELSATSSSLSASIEEVAETADAAQEKALDVEATAEGLSTTISQVSTVANQAKSDADTARTAAGKAQSTADSAVKQVTSLSATVDGIETSVAAAQETADSAVEAASAAQQSVDGFKTTVSQTYATKTSVSAVEDKADAAQSTANSAASAASTAQSTANTAKSNAAAAQTAANTAKTNAAAAQDAADAAQADLDEYKGTVSSTYATKSSVEQTADSIKSEVAATYTTKTEFEGLEIGGRNLLLGTAYKNLSHVTVRGGYGMVSIDTSDTVGSRTSLKIVTEQVGASGARDVMHDLVPKLENKKVVVSFWVKGSVAASMMVRIGGGYTAGSTAMDKAVTTSWSRVVLEMGPLSGNGSSEPYVIIAFNKAGIFRVSGMKCEYGTKATDWSPAPEDMLSTADASATYATKTALTQTEDSITAEVAKTYQTKDGMSSYASKSYVDQQDSSIKSTVSSVQTTANNALSKASTVEQTAEGLEVTLTETTTTANSALSTANAAKTAAANAQTAANDAAKTATNYLGFSSAGLAVGDMTKSTLGKNVLITSDSVQVRDGSTVYSEFGEDSMRFMETVREAVIEMMAGLGTITGSKDGTSGVLTIAAHKGKDDASSPKVYIEADGAYDARIGVFAQDFAGTGGTNYGLVAIVADEIQLPQGNITTADLYEAVGGWERGY